MNLMVCDGEWSLIVGSWQLGYHPKGRFRVLSERHGGTPLCPTLRIGRTAEVSWGRRARGWGQT